MTVPPRARAQALALRQGDQHTLAVPLGLHLAARIQERPLGAFFSEPTQLANGLRDLVDAVHPDGVPVTAVEALGPEIAVVDTGDPASGGRIGCAVEATRRLRQSMRDELALLAVLPGPAEVTKLRRRADGSADLLIELCKVFLEAGVDGLLLIEEAGTDHDWGQIRTIANVARFHRAVACWTGPVSTLLHTPTVAPLDAPAAHAGLVITDGEISPDTGVPRVQDWVRAVRS